MSQAETARSGFWTAKRLDSGLRYAYRPEFLPLLLEYVGAKAGDRILEVGCGSGFLARLLARSLADVQVTGLDTDGALLEVADQLAAGDALTEQLTFNQGDTLHLPFADNSFDLVTSHRLL